jgi:hypothetical protein
MADPYKSVLESYNENLRPRRLPAPEEEAIEPMYPEQYLIGGPGKAVASGLLKPSAKKAALRKEIAQTKIGSNLIQKPSFPDLLPPDRLAKYKEAAKKKSEQINRIKNQQKILNAAENSFERTSKNFSGEAGHDVGGRFAEHEERRNAAGDTYKKGGKVSSASSRGDGCAVRGKTKGSFV